MGDCVWLVVCVFGRYVWLGDICGTRGGGEVGGREIGGSEKGVGKDLMMGRIDGCLWMRWE